MVDAPPVTSGDENYAGSSTAQDDGSDRPKKARRTFLTQNACRRCRQKKSKCNGARPICDRCEKNGAECVYDVAQEGLTRMQSLQQRLEESEASLHRLTTLVNALQRRSDDQASNLLARLRLGDDVENLISFLEPSEGNSALRGPEERRESGSAQTGGDMRAYLHTQTVTTQAYWSPWTVQGAPGSAVIPSHANETLPDASPIGDSFHIPDRGIGQNAEHQTDGQHPSQYEYYSPDPSRYFGPTQWQRPGPEDTDGTSGG